MNKSMWFLVAFLALCSILLGLALGYINSEATESEVHPIVDVYDKAAKPIHKNAPVDTSPPKKSGSKTEGKIRQETLEAMEQPEAPYVLDQYAIETMTNARINGDDRAPPIGQRAESERPTTEELGSPELYLEYEARQEKKIYKAYIEAADRKVEMLEAQIIKAREQGLSEEELEVGVEKIKRIKNMKAQLLLDNPELKN